MIKLADKWTEYEVIATGDGMKLERWGALTLLRPDPQIIWHPSYRLDTCRAINAVYERSSSGGGQWKMRRDVPSEFVLPYRELRFSLKLMGFKHTGLFPEQAVNWDAMDRLVRGAGYAPNVLNLFGYTGGATVSLLSSGASVCHVDAARAMVDRCRENVALSGLADKPCRYIVDDCVKFVTREIRRGKRYDAIVMDPPSYGRGPTGETWKLETDLYDFLCLCVQLLSDHPLFVLINSYTTGLQPTVIENLLKKALATVGISGRVQGYELGVPTREEGIVLPCGCSGLFTADENFEV